MFRLLRTINLAVKSLLLHKLRSSLTMLGIVFGVFSVIAMLAIGEGASKQAQDQVLELGATNIIVRSVKPPEQASSTTASSNSFILRYGLLREDLKLLSKENISGIERSIPIREVSAPVRYRHREMNCRVVGCTSGYFETNNLNLRDGRFITEHDQVKIDTIAVVAAQVAETLFPGEDPIGKSVQINGEYYEIRGITRTRGATAAIGGSLSGQDYNKDIYIPLKTMQVRMGDDNIQRKQGSFSAESIQLHQITLQISGTEDKKAEDLVIPISEVVRETMEINHKGKKDWSIIVPMELLEQAKQIQLIFNLVLGSIAAISLVVGGIGIMNIMLATVTERTREIGVRRALGARQRDIIEQFLVETIVLSGVGGAIGMLLGWLTPQIFSGTQWVYNKISSKTVEVDAGFNNMFADLTPDVQPWTLGLAFGISVGIGIIFGVYPAMSAARLDPIEALRHE
ncbi:MAG: ABC transporter permease [Planctomycetaceae bacterium]|jgi:putative ABC transport system permease protein|nr:ABC transporter permease [Planctomycetaceae bacterium]MDG2391617.1 ABC transporter permease [Planctomycetaceae bacterium]